MPDTDTATAEDPPVRTRAGSPFAALGFRPFRWWFVSQILSASGGMTQAVAASWLVLQLTGSAFDLGLLSAVSMLPSLLAGAWCGALVDRLDRRRALIATQGTLTVLSLALYALVEAHCAAYWSILALSAAGGTVIALDGPARQVYVLDLVGRRRLAGAVSLYEVILNTSRVLGPALGGLMLTVSGPGSCILVNALSYLAPLAVLLALRRPNRDAAEEPGDGAVAPEPRPASRRGATPSSATPAASSRRGATRAGLRYAWSVPAIRSCLLIAAASGILFSSGVLFPLLADRVFHLGGGGTARCCRCSASARCPEHCSRPGAGSRRAAR